MELCTLRWPKEKNNDKRQPFRLPSHLFDLLVFDSFIREEKNRNLGAVSDRLQPLIIGFFRVKRHIERLETTVARRSYAVALKEYHY